ncbi:MAG: trypsin-like peptidase domain-containing protein, partial [Planctomycetales bacterium]|nr:trypsin-like peptidase domain-containing protein [Planctomycetales bacterium]
MNTAPDITDWRSRRWPLILLALAMGSVLGFGLREQLGRTRAAEQPMSESSNADDPAVDESAFQTDVATSTVPPLHEDLAAKSRRVVATTSASVVRIDVERDAGQWSDSAYAGEAHYELPTTEQGTAVVISADGYLLTNLHLIQAARRITATHERFAGDVAEIIGVDKATDLAVLRLNQTDLSPIAWSERSAHVGEFVWALGYPFGFQRSASFGIISAIHEKPPRKLGMPFGCLQT